jgi:phosphoribosyl 1,2-cyclic phosphodiesterase
VEVRCGEDLVVLDAGSGLHGLGKQFAGQASPRVHLFLSHFHWDHIQGLPFFGPMYDGDAEVTLYSHANPDACRRALETQMSGPFFPFDWEKLPARIRLVELNAEPVRIGAMEITHFALHHPQGATGFRIQGGGKTFVYATDHELGLDAAADAGLVEAAGDADLLLLDGQYTPAEYREHVGWGHSSWRHAVRCAADAQARRLLLFHHDPGRTDDELKAMVADAAQEFAVVDAACEATWYEL